MKILFISHVKNIENPQNGIEIFLNILVRSLLKKGIECKILSFSPRFDVTSNGKLYIGKTYEKLLYTFFYRTSLPLTVKNLIRKFDIVHILPSPREIEQKIGIKLRKLTNKIITTIHYLPQDLRNLFYFKDEKGVTILNKKQEREFLEHLKVLKRLSNYSKYVIVPSAFSQLSWKRYGINSKIIYNGIDVKMFRSARQKKKYDIIYISRVNMPWSLHKNFHILFYVMNQLKNMGMKYKLCIVGGKFDFHFKKIISTLDDLITTIKFVSHKDLNKFYNQAKIFVTPSCIESFSFVSVEAMACELPIVIPNYGVYKEISKNSENIMVDVKMQNFLKLKFPIPKVDDLTRAIIKMLKYDKRRRKRIGKNNRKIVKSFFTSKLMVKNYLKIYESL